MNPGVQQTKKGRGRTSDIVNVTHASYSVICFAICALLSVCLLGFTPQAALAETNDAGNKISVTATSSDIPVFDVQEKSASYTFNNGISSSGSLIADFSFNVDKSTKAEIFFQFTTSKSRTCTFSLYKGDTKIADLGYVAKSGSYTNTVNTLDGTVHSAGNGIWSYSATLEPGDYFVRAQSYSSGSGTAIAQVKMKAIVDSSQTSSGENTSTGNSSSDSNTSQNPGSDSGNSSVSQKPGSSSANSNNSSANNSANNSVTNPATSSGTQTATAASGKWIHSSKGWWYRFSDGSYAKGLQNIQGKTYYFDNNGWRKTGWQQVKSNSDWYYFNSSGAMQTGWKKVSGKWYYMNSEGKMLTGKQTIGKNLYYLSNSGAMRTGWVQDNNAWYYCKSSGEAVTGWVKVGKNWYYMNSDHTMATGWLNDSGSRYYLQASGAMSKGWKKIGANWYYFANSGAMKTDWLKKGGKWYYLDHNDGRMLTGSFYDYLVNGKGGNRYYANASGEMQTGWQKINNKWYYFGSSGAMTKNAWISGKYWVGSNGAMATNSWVDNGKYYVNSKGVWVKDKKPSSSSNQTPIVTTDVITDPIWYEMTAVSTTGSNGLVPILNPSNENSVKFYEDGTYVQRLTSNNETKNYPGYWEYDYTQNGKRYYWLKEDGQYVYRASLSSSGSLILMMVSDTDYVQCYEAY